MQERREAERIVLPRPVPGTFGGFDVRIVQFSLVGCQIEHADRVVPKSKASLKFKWRGNEVKVEATVIRSEMRSVGGKAGYASGLEFCATPNDSPVVVREIVQWLQKPTASGATAPGSEPAPPREPAAPPTPAPAPPIARAPAPTSPAVTKTAPAAPPRPAAPSVKPAVATPAPKTVVAPPSKPVPPAAPKPAPAAAPKPAAAASPKPTVAAVPKPAAPAPKPAAPQPKPAPPPPEPLLTPLEVDEEFELLTADYVQCTFDGREWSKLYTSDPSQPANGFTVVTPPNENEIDLLCRAYAKADPEKRRAMRETFERQTAQKQR